MRQAERGGGVINLFNSYPGDRKNIWRDGGGVCEGSLKLGTQIKMYPAPTTTPDPPDDK